MKIVIQELGRYKLTITPTEARIKVDPLSGEISKRFIEFCEKIIKEYEEKKVEKTVRGEMSYEYLKRKVLKMRMGFGGKKRDIIKTWGWFSETW